MSDVSSLEKLITDMHDLEQEIEENKNNPGFDIVNAAEAIKAARNEWKKLAKGEHAGDQELWQRFDAACNQAYEPCQRYFAEQAELRVENVQKRQALCQ